MSMPKIGGIVGLLLVGFILNVVSVFTSGWIVLTIKAIYYSVSKSFGIVPYNSANPGWFNAASWMMFISFAAYLIVIIAAANAVRVTRHHGCSHTIRHAFHTISGLCALIGILIAIAFILMAANVSSFAGTAGSLGYSAYLALVCMILTFIAGALSGHVTYYDCC